MLTVRKAQERGGGNHGWLKTRHTFSFADYHDPRHVHFRSLRVMNEDWIAPGQGFGMHPHRDMEIVTYVLEGSLEHRDSMGNGSVLRAGELQRMSAGTGVLHSEFNPSSDEPVHLYQIWLFPEERGVEPSYEEKRWPAGETRGWKLMASRDARQDSARIHQDADILLGRLPEGATLTHTLRPRRHVWLQVLRGQVEAQGQTLTAGDGLAVSDEAGLTLTGRSAAEVLLFDLA